MLSVSFGDSVHRFQRRIGSTCRLSYPQCIRSVLMGLYLRPFGSELSLKLAVLLRCAFYDTLYRSRIFIRVSLCGVVFLIRSMERFFHLGREKIQPGARPLQSWILLKKVLEELQMQLVSRATSEFPQLRIGFGQDVPLSGDVLGRCSQFDRAVERRYRDHCRRSADACELIGGPGEWMATCAAPAATGL